MTALATSAFARWRPAVGRPAALGALVSVSIFVFIGIELAVLVTVLPTTVEQWWTASSTGDFGNFYNDAKNLDINGLYSPGLSLLMYPLTWLSMVNAYRVYVALGGVALLAVAYLAQREITLPEGRIAMALGVVSIPQLHWALRLGHFTTILALVALSGFLLLRKHPILAGLCFALLVLKPQYAVIPAFYLLWTRNGRALAAMAAGALVIEVAGFAAVGFSALGPYLGGFVDLSADARDNLLPYQQSWQYAWQGFLISAGIAPHPLVAIDLSLLSLGVVVVAWARGTKTAALTAAALGMLIVTPYANFYDWGLLVVAAVLLLRTDVPWKAAIPVLLASLYVGLLVSQAATPFPAVDVILGVIAPDGSVDVLPASYVAATNGIYWITPLVLGTVALLAFAGRKPAPSEETPAATEEPLGEPKPGRGRLGAVAWFGLAAVIVPAAYFTSAFYGEAPPFKTEYDPFAPSAIVKQVPADFPLPEDAKLLDAGPGEQLPFHIEWTSSDAVSEISVLYEELLARDVWELMLEDGPEASYDIRLAKFTSFGFMTHWGMLAVAEAEEGSLITLDLFVTQLITVTAGADGGLRESQ